MKEMKKRAWLKLLRTFGVACEFDQSTELERALTVLSWFLKGRGHP
jgi:hypothetical protein